MRDMDKAVARIDRALAGGETIAVFGDYDVDGITSTCLLTDYLRSRGGAHASPAASRRATASAAMRSARLPSRASRSSSPWTAASPAWRRPPLPPPSASTSSSPITTNVRTSCPPPAPWSTPHRPDCGFPFKHLAGVGVALELVLALGGAERENALFSRYCTAAIGTIADVMRMEGENRTIVQCGLEGIDRSDFTGLHALLREARLTGRPVSSVQIGFVLAPASTPPGAWAARSLAAELLLTQDPAKAERLARELCDLNRERQSVEQDIFRCAIEQMDTLAPHRAQRARALQRGMASGAWSASSPRVFPKKILLPQLHDPPRRRHGRGSCRSYGGFNLFAALEACSDLLVGFGGHEARRGLHHQGGEYPRLPQAHQSIRPHPLRRLGPVSSLEIDAALTRPSLITLQEVEELSRLEPYGAGNNRPVFCLRGARLESMQSVGQNKHLKLRLQKGHTSFDGIFFSVTPAECGLTVGERVDAAFYLQVNEFRGSRSLQLQLVDLRSAHDPGAREAEQQAVPHADPRRRRERERTPQSSCPRVSSSCASGVRSSARWTARSPLRSCPSCGGSPPSPRRGGFPRTVIMPRGFCRARARDRRAPRQIHHAPSHRRQACGS